jgi:hypothetical protein
MIVSVPRAVASGASVSNVLRETLSLPLAALILGREDEYKISRNRLLVRVAGAAAF